MSSFTLPLTVTKIGKRLWRVERSFDYFVGEENSDFKISVPKDFLTDFASVPRAFWCIFPPDGQYTQAAVLHDFIYSKRGLLEKRELSRKECDDIFLEAMGVLEVGYITKTTIYLAVRGFGWIPW